MIIFVFSEMIPHRTKICPAGTSASPWLHATLTWLAREGCTCEFAVVRVCREGTICVRMSRATFCKMDVISEFAVSAKDCGEIFFP